MRIHLVIAKTSEPGAEPSDSDVQKRAADNLPLAKETNKTVKIYEELAKGS